MSIAVLAWVAVAVVFGLIILITFISMLPELRRYLRIRHM
jgi:hypothetical protein